MKTIFLFIAAVLFSIPSWSQENRVTLSGGYAFANVEEVDADATGWRINGLYEFNPNAGNIAHGLSIGYIGTSSDYQDNAGQSDLTSKYKISAVPIYYAPKFMFGKGSGQGFIKGAIGAQFSSLNRTGTLVEVSDNDFGFYGGAGIGFMKTFKERMFINIEYEWAYMSNCFYKDGFMNSAMLGVGMKF